MLDSLFVFRSLQEIPWFAALTELDRACAANDRAHVFSAYSALYGALVDANYADLLTAAAELRFLDSGLVRTVMNGASPPESLEAGALYDLETLLPLLRRDWQREAARVVSRSLPPLSELVHTPESAEGAAFLQILAQGSAEGVLERLLCHYRDHGVGVLAKYAAFRWTEGELQGVAHPAEPEMARLVGLERPLERLTHNTEAFLEGRPAQHTLLYGPRGSGKSTAVKSLLPRYRAQGLRLVELPPHHLTSLPDIIERLRFAPQRFLLFVDDLSFDAGDGAYAPLKTLLEGSLTARPDNVLVYATSNRRHLVKERFSDRPDPLDDDVHGWDTQNERLALADRFGLTLTFPSASQARYLEIAKGLAEREGLGIDDLEARAIRFAEWGNGLSGRTAQQFIDTLKAELA